MPRQGATGSLDGQRVFCKVPNGGITLIRIYLFGVIETKEPQIHHAVFCRLFGNMEKCRQLIDNFCKHTKTIIHIISITVHPKYLLQLFLGGYFRHQYSRSDASRLFFHTLLVLCCLISVRNSCWTAECNVRVVDFFMKQVKIMPMNVPMDALVRHRVICPSFIVDGAVY